MFVLVFPGFTGILAGSNLSPELQTPSRSIARGSLASLSFVLASYWLIVKPPALDPETAGPRS